MLNESFLLSCLIFLLSCHGSIHVDATAYICEYYIAESKIPGVGRAVIAGKEFTKGDVAIDKGPTLVVRTDTIGGWQLNNYMYASEDDDYSMLVFGVPMLYNHKPLGHETLHHYWYDTEVTAVHDQFEAYSTYTTVSYKFANSTLPGEEIFTSYGGDDWFADRDMPVGMEMFPEPYDLGHLKQVGFCLSHVAVAESTFILAGNGLFARKDFKKGEIVSISPVLLLPFDEVLDTAESSLLVNYVISKPRAKVALLPVALPVMANHEISGIANMEISWFAWHGRSIKRLLDMPIDALMAAPFAQLDLQYVATRDIAAGEELSIDYGVRWMAAWAEHLASRVLWEKDRDPTMPMPIFRHPIEAADGLFPSHWFDGPGVLDDSGEIIKEASSLVSQPDTQAFLTRWTLDSKSCDTTSGSICSEA